MKKKKMSNCIKFIIFLFPLLLISFAIFRNGEFDIDTVESYFSGFRSLDFGLSGYINTILNGSLSFSACLLMIDLFIYFLYFKLFDLIYSCFGVFIDLIRSFFEKFGGDK